MTNARGSVPVATRCRTFVARRRSRSSIRSRKLHSVVCRNRRKALRGDPSGPASLRSAARQQGRSLTLAPCAPTLPFASPSLQLRRRRSLRRRPLRTHEWRWNSLRLPVATLTSAVALARPPREKAAARRRQTLLRAAAVPRRTLSSSVGAGGDVRWTRASPPTASASRAARSSLAQSPPRRCQRRQRRRTRRCPSCFWAAPAGLGRAWTAF